MTIGMLLVTAAATDGLAAVRDAAAATEGVARCMDALAMGQETLVRMAGLLGAMDGPNPGRIADSLISYVIAGAVAALVSTVIALPVIRQQMKQVSERLGAVEQDLKVHGCRLAAIETACPERRMDLVSKSEMVRLTATIHAVGNRVEEKLDEFDQRNEARVKGAHDRINRLDSAVAHATGRLESHLRETA